MLQTSRFPFFFAIARTCAGLGGSAAHGGSEGRKKTWKADERRKEICDAIYPESIIGFYFFSFYPRAWMSNDEKPVEQRKKRKKFMNTFSSCYVVSFFSTTKRWDGSWLGVFTTLVRIHYTTTLHFLLEFRDLESGSSAFASLHLLSPAFPLRLSESS
ncbi:hypothetical protein BJX62DRAFT_221193 [Aspergillus germanicus]